MHEDPYENTPLHMRPGAPYGLRSSAAKPLDSGAIVMALTAIVMILVGVLYVL